MQSTAQAPFSRLRWLIFSVLLAGCVFIGRTAGASEGFDALVQLAQSGASTDDSVKYINSATFLFALTDHEKEILSDLGVDDDVFKAAHDHDVALVQANAYTVAETPGTDQVQWDAEAAAPEGNEVDVGYFYKSLSPYGNWIEVDGAQCWRPTAALIDARWRPYCNRGRWVYSDQGWTWVSEYSWGWAPFHYGRWHRHEAYGWVWTPDTTWGPAWVTWRMDEGNCAWAPLPPSAIWRNGAFINVSLDFGVPTRDFICIEFGHLQDPRWWEHRHSKAEKYELWEHLHPIENHYAFRNNVIFHAGPDIKIVNQRLPRPIQTVSLVNLNVKVGSLVIGARFETGDKLALFRPNIRDERKITPSQVLLERETRLSRYQIDRAVNVDVKAIVTNPRFRDHPELIAPVLPNSGELLKVREAEVQAARLRAQQLQHEQEARRIENARKDAAEAAVQARLQAAQEVERRRAEELRHQQEEAARNAEAARRAAEQAEKERARAEADARKRQEDALRAKQQAEFEAQREKTRAIQEAQAREAAQRQLEQQRAAQEAERARLLESRRQAEEASQVRAEALKQAAEQRAAQQKALEDAQRNAADRSNDRRRDDDKEDNKFQRGGGGGRH